MPPVTLALVAALMFAGCGDDEKSSTSAGSGATASVPQTTTSASEAGSKLPAAKDKGAKKNGTTSSGKSSRSKKSSGSKETGTTSGGSKTSSGSRTSSGSKKGSGSTTSSGGGDEAGGGSDDSGGSGDSAPTNSREDRLEVVATVRRYQKAFLDFDGKEACSLLTTEGKRLMISGARAQSCPSAVLKVLDQAKPADIRLIEKTRDGLKVSDVKIRDGRATVDIGGGQRLRLEFTDGRWLVSDPSP